MESIIVALAAGGAALLFALFTAMRVIRADAGNQRMRAIGDSIREGAGTFLRREYFILAPFVIIVAAGLWVLITGGPRVGRFLKQLLPILRELYVLLLRVSLV